MFIYVFQFIHVIVGEGGSILERVGGREIIYLYFQFIHVIVGEGGGIGKGGRKGSYMSIHVELSIYARNWRGGWRYWKMWEKELYCNSQHT